MATTLMQPATHRPSMDHAASFDNRRTATTSAYDKPSVPRSRTNSNNSVSAAAAPAPSQAAYPQPYANTYFPPANPYPIHQQPTWPAAAVPASSFYAPPFHTYPGTQAPVGFPQGYQQGHPDFSAWAHVYQQMVAGGHMPGPGHLPPPSQQRQPELDDNSEATRSGRSSTEPAMVTASAPKGAQQPQAFHPYKRLPKGAAMPRSQSTDGHYPMSGLASPGKPSRNAAADDHRRTGSGSDSFGSISPASLTSDLAPPPKHRERERPPSVSSQGSSRGGSDRGGTRSPAHSAPSRTASPGTTTGSTRSSPAASAATKSTPLAAGPIAANATNAPPAPHPSPLSQSATTSEVDATEKKAGGKGRFVGKEKGKEKEKPQDTSSRTPSSTKPAPSRVEASATSRAPLAPTKQSLAPPAAPFANPKAMSSDISLAETERTAATTTASVSGSKPRRGLFRMKNKSSDNISLSSTVSSASMMIRKMGNIGKLARRNSLMGISKIFKEKPKESDDAAAPEKDGMFSFKKKSGKKTTAAPATVSHAYAELDRVSEEDDRLLSGLTPAARLARRHTVRSRAEQLKREADRKAEEDAASARTSSASTPAINEFTGGSAEPTWDKNTTTRVASSLPAVQEAEAPKTAASGNNNGANVLHVTAPRTASVVHAVAVNQADYDSADSSEGETIENPSNPNRNSAAEDAEFQAVWGKSNIDPALRPKKGILKNNVSNEDLEGMASRQRSNSANDVVSPAVEGPLSQLPAPLPERIDGNAHASHSKGTGDEQEQLYDPLSPNFSPFDSPSIELDYKPSIYKNPTHNTSAPTLSLGGEQGPGQQIRSMTVPARRRLIWAPECAVYSTYDSMTYDRRSEPATCNRLTPELALQIKQELNAFKLEMPVHPQSKGYTHFFS